MKGRGALIQHCVSVAAHHAAMSKCFGKAAKECGDDSSMGECFKNCADLHLAAGEDWLGLGKSIREDMDFTDDDSIGIQGDSLTDDDADKLFGMTAAKSRERDLNKIQPPAARAVMPSDIPAGLTLIGRPGGPPINKATVPAEFADLVGE